MWGTTAFFKTAVPYVTVSEAQAGNEFVQVMGKIDTATVQYSQDLSRLEFTLIDMTDSVNAQRLPVVYYGTVPGNFDQATSVVVKGKPQEGQFVAEQILVKCPSKYQGDGAEYQDMSEHKGPNTPI